MKRIFSPQVLRWFVVGIVFAALGIALLKMFVGALHWPYAVATLVSGELGTILRFFAVDRWVFGHSRPTLRRLWQYHIASALGFGIWWSASNVLNLAGVQYLAASVLGMCFSVGFSALSNFFWVWRKPLPKTNDSAV